MKRYHKSLVFHHPYPLELQCKLEFLPLPVIASIGHIGGLRHTHKVKFAMLSASEARSLECQVGANIGLLSAPFFRLLLCLGICPTQPSLTTLSAILPLQRAKEEWDAQTKDRWHIVLWKLVKAKPFIWSLNLHMFKDASSRDVEQHPSWSPPSFVFDNWIFHGRVQSLMKWFQWIAHLNTICSPTE